MPGVGTRAGGDGQERVLASTFMTDFKRFFFRGLAAVLPTVLTVAIIVWVFKLIDRYMGQYVNIGIAYVVTWIRTYRANPAVFEQAFSENFTEFWRYWSQYFWWVGFLGAIVFVYVFGRFVASVVGRWIWRFIEGSFFRMPIIKAVYPSVKQVTDFLLAERKISTSRVVAVEYPRKGIWSLGLATAAGMRQITEQMSAEMLTVFIPSSPTPVTGYTVTVRADEVIELPITLDEALRFTVTGGVIMPLGQRPDGTPDGARPPGRLPSTDEKETSV